MTDNFKTNLRKQFAIGMSYGSKVYAEVIMDKFKPCVEDGNLKLDKITDAEKKELLEDIYNFSKTTISTDINETIKVMSSLPLLKKLVDETVADTMKNNNNIENEKGEN